MPCLHGLRPGVRWAKGGRGSSWRGGLEDEPSRAVTLLFAMTESHMGAARFTIICQ